MKDFWKLEDFKITKYNYITCHIIMTFIRYFYFQIYKNLEKGKIYAGKSLLVIVKNYKGGNLKISSQLREILGLYSGQRVTVHLDYDDPASDEINIPQEILDEAGICADNGLEIYTDDGQIIIQEVNCDGE